MYDAITHRFGWHRAHHHIRYVSSSVFYYVRVWDSEKQSMQSYFLNSDHLCKACGIRDIGYLWALSDFGIADALSTYTAENNNSNELFDICVNGKYIMQYLSNISHSLHIPENVTVSAIVYLCLYLGAFGDEYEVSKFVKPKVTIMDYELEEKNVALEDWLVAKT
jgi:hypothetical protein